MPSPTHCRCLPRERQGLSGLGRQGCLPESFLIGERAARHRRIESEAGEDAAETDLGNAPPDLVIEVEHYDPGKADIYRAAGVTELWDLATGAAGHSPRITSLQTHGGPQPSHASGVLPPVRADALPAALAELKALGGVGGFGVRMGRDEPVAERLLKAVGIVHADLFAPVALGRRPRPRCVLPLGLAR